VTNSSSSAFVIKKKRLTDRQIYMISDHAYFGSLFNGIYAKLVGSDQAPFYMDEWKIEEDETEIRGETSMDNFGMEEFFEHIGVDDKYVRWSVENYHDLDTKYKIPWHGMTDKEINKRVAAINRKKNLK
jgi:hypothetical protein